MKKFLIVLLSLFVVGCHHNRPCTEEMVMKLELVLNNVQCSIPAKPKLEELSTDKYIAEKKNVKVLTDNYILMNDYNKKMEGTIECYFQTLTNIKDEVQK